ncbi:MAG: carotenoid biosynthesis protein [Myxococcota bacterium]
MDALLTLLTQRPYVVAFLIAFLVISRAERGWTRTGFWLASGTALGWLAEFSSVRTGFPFGHYRYHAEHFPSELWLGGIPLFASLSFAFLTYFGYSAACTLRAPLEGRGLRLARVESPTRARSLVTLALAAVLTTWMDTVMDPVTHLGRYWFLGDLYAYAQAGFHFGVPLSNYAGWLVTSAVIVGANQRFDVWLSRRKPDVVSSPTLPLQPLWALACCVGNLAFMLAVTAYLLVSGRIPEETPLPAILASGLVLSGLFVGFATLRLRQGWSRKALTPRD